MNEKNLYDALEVCLQAVETGADIESALKRYPLMAEQLRPMLETSLQARTLTAPSIPEAAMRRGRARVLQYASEMRESAQSSRRSIFSFPRLAISLALMIIFVLSGTGLVRASTEALPGDNLYPVKRSWEDLRFLFVFNSESRKRLHSEFEQKRLEEISELLNQGRHEMISFAGMVTEQNGDQWMVADIPVRITPDSELPAEPVTIGTMVMVEGRTASEGVVEAKRIEILETATYPPPVGPTEVEVPENTENENVAPENNINDDDNEVIIEILEDNQNGNGNENGNENENMNNFPDDENDGNDDSNNNDSGSGDNDDDSGDDNSNSGEGDDDSGSGGGGGDGDDD